MIWIGVDAHKKVLVATAINDAGQVVARWKGKNGVPDWQEFFSWVTALEEPASSVSKAPTAMAGALGNRLSPAR